ncbi:hypothetical protein THASP1DRAFT_33724 [Thamnocephalis sphaerospora]|uniref:Uncharacterized protein n=1 Tax=Thamnocephalis sphaerospora TaxID=78915 RepID=A0A4P9XFY9_9FUNG|nr:hypothetical protein THASP1DRAFT_33724 [Thamnocephalis sphaerospora]|eukprot:RKP04502.1 hypothetical protein THASP1DRAFT_33724 [Thamnocephalis sphaerospora]
MQGIAKAFTRVTARSKHRDVSVTVENGHPALTLRRLHYHRRSGNCRAPLLPRVRPREKATGEFVMARRSSAVCGAAAYELSNATAEEVTRNSHGFGPPIGRRPTQKGHSVWLLVAWEVTIDDQCRFAVEVVEAEGEDDESGPPIDGGKMDPYGDGGIYEKMPAPAAVGNAGKSVRMTAELLSALLDLLQTHHGEHRGDRAAVTAWPTSLDGMYTAGEVVQRHCMLDNGVCFAVHAAMSDVRETELHITLSEERFESRSVQISEPVSLRLLFPNAAKEEAQYVHVARPLCWRIDC